MRQQSEKLSSEIKRNFKTTFKTSTEVTDTTSKRYVIANKTTTLVNYELRRKMRKVGVQVQDIGVADVLAHLRRRPGQGPRRRQARPHRRAARARRPGPARCAVDSEHSEQDVNIHDPVRGLDTDDTDNAYTDGSGRGRHLDFEGAHRVRLSARKR